MALMPQRIELIEIGVDQLAPVLGNNFNGE